MVEYRIQIPEELHKRLQARQPAIDVAQVCVDALRGSTSAAEKTRPIVADLVWMFNPHRRGG